VLRYVVALTIPALLLAAACGADGGSDTSATATIEPVDALSMCRADHRVAGRVQSPELVEISGIAASRKQQNIEIAGTIWAHNDSGDTARFFAIDADGSHRDVFNLVGAEAIDIEDMAVGPGPDEGETYVYLADIGDNNSQREEIVVYRVPEPTITHDSLPVTPSTVPASSGTSSNPDLTDYDTLALRYPDGAHDAETLLVDPVDGDLVIVTKNIATGRSQVFRASASAADGEMQTLEEIAQINFAGIREQIILPPDAGPLARGAPHIPTGGDVSPDGSLLAIRTYGGVVIWPRPAGAPLAEAFANTPCLTSSVSEQQGEAIAFNASGTGYITISEGKNPLINEFVVE
jgi:hypothetical protein